MTRTTLFLAAAAPVVATEALAFVAGASAGGLAMVAVLVMAASCGGMLIERIR